QGEGLGQCPDWADQPAGKIPAAHEPTRLRDRARADRDLGQVDGLYGGCVRLQVRMADVLEQTHSVRLVGSVTAHACRERHGALAAPSAERTRVDLSLSALPLPAVRLFAHRVLDEHLAHGGADLAVFFRGQKSRYFRRDIFERVGPPDRPRVLALRFMEEFPRLA